MIDGEPQIWVRREMPEADSKLKEASELILQAVRGEQRQNVKARLAYDRADTASREPRDARPATSSWTGG